ncbi:MAG TPA: hypothetical protein VMZ25_04065, partial [Terriglobales bacterium]|nr:hypothetical protein [Terriglobales bacterium]
ILWSSYLHQGYSALLQVYDLQVNAAGEVYIAGTTDDFNGFPTTPGAFERNCPVYDIRVAPVCAFVAKLSKDGSQLLFSSFFGGQILGMIIRKLRLDGAGNVILAGDTFSAVAYVAKLDSQFSKLLFIRRLGGTGYEQVTALEMDSTGIYVGGGSHSSDFPATTEALKPRLTGESDGFVTKLSHEGNVIFSTLIGGSGYDAVSALTLEGSSLLIGGITGSLDFPVSAAAYQSTFAGGRDDAFVASLSADGSRLLFSTYLGGTGDPVWTSGEAVLGIARLNKGSLQVVGRTSASDFPLKNSLRFKPSAPCQHRGGCNGIFVSSFDSSATELLASTVAGSQGEDSVWGVVSATSGWWVTGNVFEDFPITPDALQPTDGGVGRAFVAHLYAGPQDFSLELAQSPLSLSSGSATTSILLAGAPAFADVVALSCEVPSATYRCRFKPQDVFLGVGRKQVSLTVERTAGTPAMALLLAPFALAGVCRRNLAVRRKLLFALFAVSTFAGCRGIVQPALKNHTITIKIVAQSQTVSHNALLQLSTDPR